MSWAHVVDQGNGETRAHSKLSKADRRGVERYCDGGSRSQARVGLAGQCSQKVNKTNETNEVEPRVRTDGCANNDEFEQEQRRGTDVKSKRQRRRSRNRQL